MANTRKSGSVRLANFLDEKMRERGLVATTVARIIQDNELPTHHLSERQILRVLRAQATLTIQQMQVLGKYLRFSPRRINDLLTLDQYDDLIPKTNDIDRLKEIAKEAYQLANYPLAYVASEKIVRLAEDAETRLTAKGNCALAVDLIGLHDLAIDLNMEMLADLSAPRARLLTAHMHIGICFEKLGNLGAALLHNTEAKGLLTPDDSRENLAVLINRANIFANRWDLNPSRDIADLDHAILLYREAAELAQLAGDRGVALKLVGNHGRCLTEKGEYPEAIRMLSESRDLASRFGDARSTTYFSAELAKAYLLSGDRERALWNFKHALHRAKHGSFDDIRLFCALYLARMAREEGRPSREFDVLVEELIWRVDRRFAELIEYEQERKRREMEASRAQ